MELCIPTPRSASATALDAKQTSRRQQLPPPAWQGVWRAGLRAWKALQHGLSAIGMATLAIAVLLWSHEPLRAQLEREAADWLLNRQASSTDSEPPPGTDTPELASLPAPQARVTDWLARKYRVASEPLASLVAEAYRIGPQLQLEPALILAVMAAESRFNPYAASPWGAHGLMQVLTHVHADKFASLGGPAAAFDPVSNLRVGAQVLREAIQRAGSVPGGLRLYVGAITVDRRDYIVKVLSETERLKRVAAGQRVPFLAPVPIELPSDDRADPAATADNPVSSDDRKEGGTTVANAAS
jgi:soluble lytic murein transglycosylase-like protein